MRTSITLVAPLALALSCGGTAVSGTAEPAREHVLAYPRGRVRICAREHSGVSAS